MTTAQALAQTGLAQDARSLDALKRQARERPGEALASVAKQFEAVFMQMLLKSMREAVPQSGLLDTGETNLYTSMLDQELAQRIGGGKGLGIAEMIVKQLGRTVAGGSAAEAAFGGGATNPAKSESSEPNVRFTPSATRLLERISSATQSGRADASAQAFVDRMLPHATEAARATGVAAPFILGQAALETGWGRHEIVGSDGTRSHNLFGIKAGAGWNGATVDVLTTEYVNGVAQKMVQKFRAYASYADSFRDYARLIGNNPRYAEVLRQGQDAAGFARGLQQAGYATDPAYAAKLTRVINHTLAMSRLG